jgi:hypothetical protein
LLSLGELGLPWPVGRHLPLSLLLHLASPWPGGGGLRPRRRHPAPRPPWGLGPPWRAGLCGMPPVVVPDPRETPSRGPGGPRPARASRAALTAGPGRACLAASTPLRPGAGGAERGPRCGRPPAARARRRVPLPLPGQGWPGGARVAPRQRVRQPPEARGAQWRLAPRVRRPSWATRGRAAPGAPRARDRTRGSGPPTQWRPAPWGGGPLPRAGSEGPPAVSPPGRGGVWRASGLALREGSSGRRLMVSWGAPGDGEVRESPTYHPSASRCACRVARFRPGCALPAWGGATRSYSCRRRPARWAPPASGRSTPCGS